MKTQWKGAESAEWNCLNRAAVGGQGGVQIRLTTHRHGQLAHRRRSSLYTRPANPSIPVHTLHSNVQYSEKTAN